MSRAAVLRSSAARLGAIVVAGALAASALGAPARAAEHYMALGLPFFEPYRVGIATLDINAGKVSGTLAPPAGDPRAAVPVTGTLADGILKLTVGSGNEAYDLAFTEDERGLHQIWDETISLGNVDPVSLFRPASDFSEPALTLQHLDENWCGQVYGGLAVELKASALKASPAAPAALAELDVPVGSVTQGPGTVKLKALWSRLRLAAKGDGDNLTVDVVLPLGQEAQVAKALRGDAAVAAVGLPNSCAETALAVVPKSKLGDAGALSDAKLKAYVEGALNRLYSGLAADGTGVGTRKFKIAGATIAKGAAGLPVFSATVTADAEAGRMEKGAWDQFSLSLMPLVTATDAGDTISLIPTITDVKTAKKTGPQLPADSAFKPVDDSAYAAAIAHRLVSWLAAAEGSRCAFNTRTAFDEPQGGYSCANAPIDDVSHPDDN